MKKILFIAALLISVSSFAQIPRTILHVPDSLTFFYKSLPAGSIIFDEAETRFWTLTTFVTSTDNLSTASKALTNESLSRAIANGNTMSDGQTIEALNGTAVFNPRFLGVNNQLSLFTGVHGSLGVGTESFLDLTSGFIGFGHGQSFFTMADFGATQSIFMGSTANFFVDDCAKLSLTDNTATLEFVKGGFSKVGIISVDDNDAGSFTTQNLPNFPGNVTSQNTTFNTGIINSTALGGLGIIVKTNNTAYANQFAFNSGAAFETRLTHTTATSDNIIIFKDEPGTVALLSDITGAQSLSDVLTIGNTTLNGQTFNSLNGDVQLNLRDGVDNIFDLTNDNGAFLKAWFYGDNTTAQFGFGANFSFINATSATLTVGSSSIAIYDNSASPTPGGLAVQFPTVISSQSGSVNTSVINSVLLGGLDIDGKTNNTAYVNQIGFNAGLAGEMLLIHTPSASDFTATLKAESGTISYLTDTSNLGNTDLTLTGLRTVTMASNNLIFTGASIGIGGAPIAAAILDLTSTTQGLLPPRMNATERDAIPTPPAGLTIYETVGNSPNFYNGTAWRRFTHTTAATLEIGGITFADSEAGIMTDSSNLFWDDTNNFFGLRQSSPKSILHISDSISPSFQITNISTGHTSTDGFRLALDETGNVSLTPEPGKGISMMFKGAASVFTIDKDSANAILQIRRTGSSARTWRFVNNGTLFSIVDDTGGSSPFCMENGVANNTLYLESGNEVGIGTANPTEKLDVQGNINTTGIYKVAGASGQTNTYTFGGGGSGDVATMTFTGGILTGVTTVP